jgi:predicted hydrolase (HD superfamily)
LSKKSPAKKMPGVVNVKQEAQRQKSEVLSKEAAAATVMQKWARGWQGRKAVAKRRHGMRHEIDYEHARFTNEFKANDEFNLNRFLGRKA